MITIRIKTPIGKKLGLVASHREIRELRITSYIVRVGPQPSRGRRAGPFLP